MSRSEARLRIAVMLSVAICTGCPPFPADPDSFGCETSTDCSSGSICAAGRCCEPMSCDDLPGQCGRFDDGCGGKFDCLCNGNSTCGAIVPNVCGCAPQTCDGRCGSVDDGCDGQLSCSCDAPMSCGGGGSAGMCGCTPISCEDRNAECGSVDNGCGVTVTCVDRCQFPTVCDGAGLTNTCSRSTACGPADCGYIDDGNRSVPCGECTAPNECGAQAPNRCGRSPACGNTACGLLSTGGEATWCGACPSDQECGGNVCRTIQAPLCWSALTEWTAVNARFKANNAVEARGENGALWLYLLDADKTQIDDACRGHGRLRLLDGVTPDFSTYTPLASSAFTLGPETCRLGAPPCKGDVSTMRIRPDGLEAFYHGNYPCYDWDDNEIYLTTRPTLDAPWSAPVYVPGLSTRNATVKDNLVAPLLLPDRRTLIFFDFQTYELKHTRRRTTAPGDTSFGPQEVLVIDDPVQSGRVVGRTPISLGCHGRRLLFMRSVNTGQGGPDRHEGRQVEILSYEPLTFGTAQPYAAVPLGTWHGNPSAVHHFSESPDCQTLYVSTQRKSFYATRVACN